jgi:glyoxylase-like metal-dependent hydrolase (beta-lactamase superfamily II)
LKPASVAVDAGTVIPTITDGFSGRAPDLGAYELNKPLPVYGPRGVKEEINPALKVTPRGAPPTMKGTYGEEPWKSEARKEEPKAQTNEPFVGPLKLYTFLTATILVPDPKDYGLKQNEVTIDRLAVLSFLIVHPKGTLLWEAGVVPDGLVGKDDPAAERATRTLSDHLGDLGYTSKGINFFAMSHAHADHAGNANAYAGSTWLVRKAERDAMFADKPLPHANPAYYKALQNTKTVIIDGDYDVFGDGRVVIKSAPGPTPGHQVLFLDLPNTGPVLLAGDLYTYPEQRTLNRFTTFDADQAQTKASREAIEAFIKKTGAQLWIQHDYLANGQRKQSPAFYN